MSDISTIRNVHCLFQANSAERLGGAMLLRENVDVVNIHSDFLGNHALTLGGCFYIESSVTFVCISSSFKNNNAGNSGGVILSNHPSDLRGAIEADYDSNSEIILIDSILIGNRAGKGGGVSGAWLDMLLIIDSQFLNNTQTGNGIGGGVIFVKDEINKKLDWNLMYNCTFSGNTGYSGGALYIGDGHIFDIRHSIFSHNVANLNGGALEIGGNVRVTATIFSENRAQESGGVFFTEKENVSLHLVNSKLTGNSGKII